MSAVRAETPKRAASWLLAAFGSLMVADAVVAAARGRATSLDGAFVVLLLAATLTAAVGLRRGARWAWWAAVVLAGAGLFFVLPVAGTILLGGSLEPVGIGWDVVFFPLTAAVLVALLSFLWILRRDGSDRDASTSEES